MSHDSTKIFYEIQAVKYSEGTLPVRLEDLWKAFSSMLSPSSDVLDLGCGSGRDLKELARRGFCVVGLEYSRPLAELARQYSRQKVYFGDMRVFDLGENQFDGIWAVASLIHVPRIQIPGVLKKLYKALRSRGILLTSMQKGDGSQTSTDGRFFELYQPNDWELMLNKAGFEIEGRQTSTDNRQRVSGERRHIEWFVTIGRKDP